MSPSLTMSYGLIPGSRLIQISDGLDFSIRVSLSRTQLNYGERRKALVLLEAVVEGDHRGHIIDTAVGGRSVQALTRVDANLKSMHRSSPPLGMVEGSSGQVINTRPRTMNGLDQPKVAKFLRAFLLAKYLRNDNLPCEIEQGLYLGSIGAAFHKTALKSVHITHILTVANSVDMPFPEDFKYKRIEVLDSPYSNLAHYFDACFAFIDEAKASGGSVLVHCFAGRSRSVTVVVAYLMKSHRLKLSQALELVKSKRPEASPNPGFILQLQRFEQQLALAG